MFILLCSVLFQVGTHGLQKQSEGQILLQVRQQEDVCSLRRLREMLETSGDVGRCIVQPELLLNDSTRSVTDKEAGDEECSTKDTTTTMTI